MNPSSHTDTLDLAHKLHSILLSTRIAFRDLMLILCRSVAEAERKEARWMWHLLERKVRTY